MKTIYIFIFIVFLFSESFEQTIQYNIRIHAVRVSNDDGSYQADIFPDNLKKWVDYANLVYSDAEIRFLFESDTKSSDFSDLNSSLINSIDSTEGSSRWPLQKSALDNIVSNYLGKLVIFFIYGDSSSGPKGSGFSWLHYNFVIMPGFNESKICGHQNISMLAHEIGHYFGLVHTFEQIFNSRDSLLKRIAQYGVEYMDGDALSSTPLDPALYKDSARPMECYNPSGINDTIYLNGILYRIPRNNIMSYYDYPYLTLTDEQIKIIYKTLQEHPFKKYLVN